MRALLVCLEEAHSGRKLLVVSSGPATNADQRSHKSLAHRRQGILNRNGP